PASPVIAPPPAAPAAARSSAPQTPLQRRLAGVASFASSFGSAPAAAPAAPIRLDPFFEVRTPERNYGPAALPGGAVSTPLARRPAAESGIDLQRVAGSGPHGRIVARDVEAAAASGGARAPAVAPLAGGQSAAEIKAIYRDRPFEEVPLDGMRSTIARR